MIMLFYTFYHDFSNCHCTSKYIKRVDTVSVKTALLTTALVVLSALSTGSRMLLLVLHINLDLGLGTGLTLTSDWLPSVAAG